MGITDNFYQQMVNTEPSQIVIYQGGADLEALIPYEDPVHVEIEVSRDARMYGVTTFEMRRRNQDAEENCSEIEVGLQRFGCEEPIRWGLNNQVFNERFFGKKKR